jgi:phospholipase C
MEARMGSLADIDHVVVLMLENRSFDNMLGKLYPASPNFNGLTGSEYNEDPKSGAIIQVWNDPGTDSKTMTIPDPNPGESWYDMNQQIYGVRHVPSPPPAPAPMSGFVAEYRGEHPHDEKLNPRNPMHYFSPEQVPALSELATAFAVADCWFASAPCQTWPNRFFAHAGSAFGRIKNVVDGKAHNSIKQYGLWKLRKEKPIFLRLPLSPLMRGAYWTVYYHDIPQALAFPKLWWFLSPPFIELYGPRFRPITLFAFDVMRGALPAYTFIEPRYYHHQIDFHNIPIVQGVANDQHPAHHITPGEHLIAYVYKILRRSRAWNKTLLIVTYDEHGGIYDHVPPPRAVPPSKHATEPFNFDRYGVRVPAVLASPYIAPGTVLRPPGNTPFDHTSILATLRQAFHLGDPLSDRDAAAPNLEGALSLDEPTNLGPSELNPLALNISPAQAASWANGPLDEFQESLLAIAAALPNSPDDVNAALERLELVEQGEDVEGVPDFATQGEAAAYVRSRMAALVPAPPPQDADHE